MNLVEMAAWWGAILATINIFITAYKWIEESPYKFYLTVQSDMEMHPSSNDNTYVAFRLSNAGTRPTTIQNVSFEYYPNRLFILD